MRFMSTPKAALLAVLIGHMWAPPTALASDLSPYGTPTVEFGEPVTAAPLRLGVPAVW